MSTPLEVLLGAVLLRLQLRLAVAESCTGGLIAHRLTNVPGSSTYFLGGVVAYDNEVKLQLLGVRLDTIIKFGAVSEACVVEMARGARQRMGAHLGLSVSGIAGPGGGTEEKPVGLVWIGLSSSQGEQALRLQLDGDRFAIKEKATDAAFQGMLEYLRQLYPDRVEWHGDDSGMGAGQLASQPAARAVFKRVEVSARQRKDGKTSPRSFTLDGNELRIEALGRRWEDALGEHILVMLPDQRVFELLYAPLEQAWYLARTPGSSLKA
jgi:PncC family amidohydrolase